MHNLNLAAAYCDEIMIMNDAKIVSSGPTAETLSENIIEEVFGVESSVFWDEYNQSQQISFKYHREMK
jgi:iron complex transport system ATP-binding protein